MNLGPKEAFEILYSAHMGTLNTDIPLRRSLSPINTRIKKYFVLSKAGFVSASQYSIASDRKGDKLLSVKFQGFHCRNLTLSCFENDGTLYGIVARKMSCVRRKPDNLNLVDLSVDEDVRRRRHGFTGTCYTLVQAKNIEDFQSETNFTKFIVKGVPYLVYFKAENDYEPPMNFGMRPRIPQRKEEVKRKVGFKRKETLGFVQLEYSVGNLAQKKRKDEVKLVVPRNTTNLGEKMVVNQSDGKKPDDKLRFLDDICRETEDSIHDKLEDAFDGISLPKEGLGDNSNFEETEILSDPEKEEEIFTSLAKRKYKNFKTKTSERNKILGEVKILKKTKTDFAHEKGESDISSSSEEEQEIKIKSGSVVCEKGGEIILEVMNASKVFVCMEDIFDVNAAVSISKVKYFGQVKVLCSEFIKRGMIVCADGFEDGRVKPYEIADLENKEIEPIGFATSDSKNEKQTIKLLPLNFKLHKK
eukprot:snap_masked-scaffold_3-processed-gene-5.36-mRNA-1 protein AED:1.00 eAED:1.00 QI:0/0/0/0/1/1/3/0/472